MTSHNAGAILMLDDEFDIMSIFTLRTARLSCHWLHGAPAGAGPLRT